MFIFEEKTELHLRCPINGETAYDGNYRREGKRIALKLQR